MKYYKRSTQTPNTLFDIYLKKLSEKELKVVLVVIRQTIGWIDKNGQRKDRDWISQKYFMNKTGLSGKSVSFAIGLLVAKGLLKCSNVDGTILTAAANRRGKKRIYYECSSKLLNDEYSD